MIELTLKKIAYAVKGKLERRFERLTVDEIVIDSRREVGGALFIPLKGANFDGHDFIIEVFNKGAVCVLSEKPIETDMPIIYVKSTGKALRDLAEYYRSLFKIQVIAVTGSVGKTTAKDMIASVITTKCKVLKTEGNYNNEIGLPLTIFKLDSSYGAAVFEMGMNQLGEISNLSRIVRPDICVITNIGVSHIENLGSREGIFKAKCEVFDYQKTGGRVIVNGDDDMLVTLRGDMKNIVFYGMNPENNYTADAVKQNGLWGVMCNIRYGDDAFSVKIPVPGLHMVSNALAATAVGHALNINPTDIKNGIESFKQTKMRMDIVNSQKDITVINDTYNASPSSMRAAIDVLAEVPTRKVCILGDMLELGKHSPRYHYEVGEYAASKHIQLIICVGVLSRYIYDGALDNASEGIEVIYYDNKALLLKNLPSLPIRKGDTLLVKASRGMGFEKIVEILL